VILAVRHKLNSKLAAIIARPDEGHSRSYHALKMKKIDISVQILVSLNAAGIPIGGKAC
jgi:hypothetical protein